MVAVEMVNRPLGLVFRFSKPSHHFSRAHLFKRTEGYDRHVTRRRLNNLEDKGKRRGMKTVSYFLLDFLANRFKEIPTRGVENFIFHRNCSDQTNSDQFPILKKKEQSPRLSFASSLSSSRIRNRYDALHPKNK